MMLTESTNPLFPQFERLEIPAPEFGHHDHVRVAFEMLDEYDFVDACARYARTVKAMATRLGAPEKFNVIITLAFMSLIAERKSKKKDADLESFLADNPDLLDKNVLGQWYSAERLASPAARGHFLLPDKLAGLC